MRSIALPALGVVAALLLASLAFVGIQAQPVSPQSGGMHPALPGLEGIPPEQLFDHFMGAQINLTDKDGNPMVLNVTPGTISAIGDNSLAITPTGQTTTSAFRITQDTVVHATPARGSLQALAVGDKVVVMTQGNSMDALVIAEHGMMGQMGTMHRMFHQAR